MASTNQATNCIFKQNQHKRDLTMDGLKLDNIQHLHGTVDLCMYLWFQQTNQQTWTSNRTNANFTNCNRWIETEVSSQQWHTLYRWYIHDFNKATNKLLIDFKQNQHKLDRLTIDGLKLHNIWHWQLYTPFYIFITSTKQPTNF